MKTDFNQLIPELNDWNNGKGIDVESWIGCIGDFEKAIGYSVIFWPSFVEIEGCVVRGGASRESVLQWLAHCHGDRKGVEATINHLHLQDLHHAHCEDNNPERLAYLGRILKEIYECKLKRDFPEKSFVVSFDEPADKTDVLSYILTFYQEEQNQPSQPIAGKPGSG
jgi:hypothetical protein